MLTSGMWILPETPIWLAEKDRLDEALASLAWLRNNEVVFNGGQH